MTVFVLGYPSDFGGADTELWHTVTLWRQFGIRVTCIPTWHADPRQQAKLERIGVDTWVAGGPEHLREVPGLKGAIVAGFCNGEFLKSAELLKALQCRTVWVNCMTWIFPAETTAFMTNMAHSRLTCFSPHFSVTNWLPPTASTASLESQMHLIRGAFDCQEFAFQPRMHERGQPFVMGRIAPDDLDKWSSNMWSIYGSVRYRDND